MSARKIAAGDDAGLLGKDPGFPDAPVAAGEIREKCNRCPKAERCMIPYLQRPLCLGPSLK